MDGVTRDDFDDGWQRPEHQAPPKSRRKNVPPPVHRNGGKPKRFITYEDYARFFGVKVDTVRHWAARGRFNPADLASVIRFYEERRGKGRGVV